MRLFINKTPLSLLNLSTLTLFSSKKSQAVCMFMLLVLILVLHLLPHVNQYKIKNTRLILLGLDGATWDIIDPLIQQNQLPNMQALMQSGTHAILHSIEPMISPSLWTSIATSRTFEDHGIDGFFSLNTNLKEKRIFDIAHEHGLTVGTYSWLLTRPIEDPFQFNIPGWMARTPETDPADYDCVQEIRLEQGNHAKRFSPIQSIYQCIKQGARLSTVEKLVWFYFFDSIIGYTEEERFYQKMMTEVDLHQDVYLHLLNRFDPELTTFNLYGSDKLAHRFWHYMYPETFHESTVSNNPNLKHAIVNYYKKADEVFGKILQHIPESSNIILLSDHGMKANTALPKQFFANIRKILQVLGVEQEVHFADVQREIILESRWQDIEQMRQIQSLLQDIQWQGDNEPVFRVRLNDDASLSIRSNFSLSWHEESPIITNETILINEKIYPTETFFQLRTFSGTHHPEGILISNGPHIKTDTERKHAELYDIAPTIFYLLDLPISEELEGQILKNIITESYLNNYQAKYCPEYTPFSKKAIKGDPMDSLYERLQSVGYTD